MKSLVVTLLLALCLAAAPVLAAGWTGYISDAKCGAGHMDGSQASINCVKACVKSGVAPVFVTMDKKVLKISDSSKVMNFLGQKVDLTGKLVGDSLTIDTVKAAK